MGAERRRGLHLPANAVRSPTPASPRSSPRLPTAGELHLRLPRLTTRCASTPASPADEEDTLVTRPPPLLSCRQASVAESRRLTFARDELRASAGARPGPVALLHRVEGRREALTAPIRARRPRGMGAAAGQANRPRPPGVAASAKRPRRRATTCGRSRTLAHGARREDIVLLVGARVWVGPSWRTLHYHGSESDGENH
jgi:hypothetical protein